MYRPEGLENPYRDASQPSNRELGDKWHYFEEGVDATLKAIWKLAKESPTGTFTFDTHVVNCPSVYNLEE